MKYSLSTSIILSILIFFPFLKSQGQTGNDSGKISRQIDSILTSKSLNGKLNGNVLVLKDGKELYQNSFGFADANKTKKLTRDYRFNIGSVYKEFPAVAIMQLKESGRLKLQDKLSTYLPGLPNWAHTISILNLLQYSGGLPKIDWGGHFSKGETVTDAMIMSDLQKIKQLDFSPGSDYLYSNYSPILLTKIVEHISGQDFQKYARLNLFDPYGLENSKISEQYPYKDKTLMAIPFNENYEADSYKISMPLILFSATTEDMYQWFHHLDSFHIVSKNSVEILSQEAKEGTNIQAPLGRCDWKNGQVVEHSHHGSSASYECVIRRFKQDDLSIIILTNQKHRNVYDISDEILALFEKG
ncbi:serine hydrolase domain-containing protein [Autumnicola musiva]|uniref:Serine hydrolase domain-containing protein n=1 Tax=Autumnicola musiva TaxID=3075589 RepID=A0ABU3D4Y9_9FLAO|nr:serine hydrolase domain-containing protein [Zunongwangia sp. F117]MDT0676597.1 serine hydrolase domain-containing protein [Zunongwangia sp. F117]